MLISILFYFVVVLSTLVISDNSTVEMEIICNTEPCLTTEITNDLLKTEISNDILKIEIDSGLEDTEKKIQNVEDVLKNILSQLRLDNHQSISSKLIGLETQHKNNETSDQLSLFVGVLGGVGIPVFLYIWNIRKTARDSLLKTSNSVHREIKHNGEAISGITGYPVIIRDIADKKIQYTNAFLDSDSYDSVIASGQFVNFDVKLQGLLREFYNRIKDHNQTIWITIKIEDKLSREKENNQDRFVPSSILDRHDAFLTQTETELLELLPKVNKELETQIRKLNSKKF